MESGEGRISGADCRYPQWQSEYEAALRESHPPLLFKRVEIAEAALLSRLHALAVNHAAGSPQEQQEEKDIDGALNQLRALKQDVLKFPL